MTKPQDGKVVAIPGKNTRCNPRPKVHQVLLPEMCQVWYPNGSRVNSLTYNTAYCSNCLCRDQNGECSEGRCCCSAMETTNLTYACPRYVSGEHVVVSDIPTACGCLPCGEFRVSFMVRVLDSKEKPIVLANVTVDGLHSYQSDEQGYVGFFVPAAQVKVNLSVHAVLYRNFRHHYFVIPGKLNSLTIHLQAMNTITIIPPQNPFIISFATLDIEIVPQTINCADLTFNQLVDLMDLLDTFSPRYGEIFGYFPANVFPENRRFTFISPVTHMLYDDSTLESLDVSLLAQRRSRSSKTFSDVPLYAIGWAQLEIYDEDGQPFDPLSPLFHDEQYSILVGFSPSLLLSLTELGELQLFAYDDSNRSFTVVKEGPYTFKNYQSEIHWAIFPVNSTLPHFPLSLVVAYEEKSTCYVATRADDPLGIVHSNWTQEATTVRVIARLGMNGSSSHDHLVYLHTGEINSCIAVPCRGELILQVMDNSKLQTSGGILIGDNLENFDTGRVGPIYRSKRGCEAIGLESEVDTPDHITLDLVRSYCVAGELAEPVEQVQQQSSPAETLVMVDQGNGLLALTEFCSVKVSVRACYGTTTTVTFISGGEMTVRSMTGQLLADSDREDMADIDIVSGDGGDLDLDDRDRREIHVSDCRDVHLFCFSFICDSRVNLTAVSQDDVNHMANDPGSDDVLDDVSLSAGEIDSGAMERDFVPCLPRSNPNSPNLSSDIGMDSVVLLNIASKDSAEFVFEDIGGEERGIFTSLNTMQVAQQKCRKDSDPDDVGVYFDCVPS